MPFHRLAAVGEVKESALDLKQEASVSVCGDLLLKVNQWNN